MSEFFTRLLKASGRSAAPPGEPRLTLAALGKHPGWDDHIPGIGVETEALAHIKQALYVSGIGGQIDAGAWEKLDAEKRLDGFDHVFLWLRAGHILLGQFWSSTDGKGRPKYPMVLCVDGEAVSTAFMLGKLRPGLDRLRDACKAASTAEKVINLCHAAQDQLRGLLSTPSARGDEIGPPLDARQHFLGSLGVGPERVALLRVLHELSSVPGLALKANGLEVASPAGLRSRNLRLPLAGDSRSQALLLWTVFLRCALPQTVPLLFIARRGVPWLELIVGEPVTDDFFCLQASPKALPLATEIPYDIAPELKTLARELETRFLGAGSSFVEESSTPPPRGALSPAPPTPEPRTRSAAPAGNKFWVLIAGAAALVIAATGAWVIFGRKSSKLREPIAVAASQPAQPPVVPKPDPKIQVDQKYQAALEAARAALQGKDFSNALVQAAVALTSKPGDSAALDLQQQAQTQIAQAEALRAQEQKYDAALKQAQTAFEQKSYSQAVAQATVALGLKTDHPAATKLIADAQARLVQVEAARLEEEKRQAALKEAQAARERLQAQQPKTETPAPVPPAIATTAQPAKFFTNSLGMEFVWLSQIRAYLGKYEVTQQQFGELLKIPADQPAQGNNLPVSNVAFADANAFCQTLSQKEHKNYSLPTKADWLAAAGLSADQLKQPGDGWKILEEAGVLKQEAIDPDHLTGPVAVGSRGAQTNGLCDLFGNIREWIAGEESAGFSYNASGGRTKYLFLPGPFPPKDEWIKRATGFRCLLRDNP